MSTHSNVAPSSVREMLAQGIQMVASGLGGKGLRPTTIRMARRIATGEPISPSQAIRMRAWLHRFGPNVASARARRSDPTSPAAVAWMLWGGDPAIDWKSDPVVKWVDAIVAKSQRDAKPALASKAIFVRAVISDPSRRGASFRFSRTLRSALPMIKREFSDVRTLPGGTIVASRRRSKPSRSK